MAKEPHFAAIILEADGSSARVVIDGGANPALVTTDYLASRASERGVDVTPEVLRALQSVAESFRAAAGRPLDAVFAQATPPQPGEDAAVEWRAGYDPANPVSPSSPAGDGRVDHYAKQCFIRVFADDHIATVRPATEGIAGRDVCGRAIPAPPGQDIPFEIDPSIVRFDDGRLVAQSPGRLRLDGSRLLVDPVLDVKGGVDFHTGHIDFEGDVHIREDIRDHFRVKACGCIAVDGLVDACHLECGKDLVAPRGIAGRGVGTIQVGQDAIVGYFDQLSGHVARTLSFSRSIRRCTLTIGGNLLGESGSLVGGETTVAGSVRVGELGSISETHTELRIARSAPEGVAPADPAAGSGVEVVRVLYPMVTLHMGPHSITFTETVKGPVRLWLSPDRALMFRISEGEAQPISALKGVTTPRAAA